jgi:hypothetical protein
MALKKMDQTDKIWVAFSLMPKNNVRLAAADIAELVLPLFESRYPNDNRPRNAIKAARGEIAHVAAAYVDAEAASVDASVDAAASNAAEIAAYAAACAFDTIDSTSAGAAFDAVGIDAFDVFDAATNVAYSSSYADNPDGDSKLMLQIRTIILRYWK